MGTVASRVRFVVIAIAVAAFAVIPSAAASTQPAGASSAATPAAGFWAVITPNASFTAAADVASLTSGAAVAHTIGAMLNRVDSGAQVNIAQGTGSDIVTARATRAGLEGTLTSLETSSSAVKSAIQARMSPDIPAIPPPHEYPVRGNDCNNKRSWCDMKFELAAVYCTEEGCETKDRITVKLTVDPGVKASRASFSSLYSPDDHSFTEIHFEWWVLCYRGENQCGSDNTNSWSGTGSHTFTMTSDVYLYNDRVTHALTLWALFIRNGRWYNDDAKTGTAVCAKKPNRYCVY